MKLPQSKFRSVLFASLLVVGLGCSSTPPNTVAIDRSANLPAEVAKTRQDFSQQADVQIQQLSPSNARKAERALNKAEENLRRNEADQAYRNLEESRAWLQQAKDVAKLSRIEFAQALKAREAAMEVKTTDMKAIAEVDEDLAGLAKRIEDGNGVSTEEKQEIADKYVDAQRKRLKVVYLDPIEQRLDTAKDRDAKSLAPRTYERASRDFKAADTVLAVAPLKRDEFLERAKTADRSSLDVISVVQQTSNASGKTTEEMVLASIAAENQASKNLQSATSERDKLSVQVAGLQQKAQPQELLEKLQAELDEDKADILMSANGQVMIRLKDLQFKSNSADLAPQAAVVLSDVKSALSNVNPKKLVVQGHTDATGKRAINQNLSEERAESVASFLKNDQVLGVAEIETIGYGASKPLGNNKTKQGRAENRRVEILIDSI